jgi:hypothetical protein
LLAPPSAARPVAVIFGVIALLWVFVVVVVVATGFWWLALIGTFVAAFPWGVILASHREENRSHGGTTITHTSGGAR